MEELICQGKGKISTLLFNRPKKRHALDADTLFLMGDILNRIERENKIRVLVIRGAGDKNFSAGVDLSCGQNDFKRTIEGLEYCLNSLINFPLPVISAIYGPAIGAGLDIAVISDFRIAAKGATFGAPLVKLGRTYYYTAIARLTRLIGLSGAKEMLLTGRLIDTCRAFEIGLVNQVVPEDALESTVNSFANELAEDTAPLAVRVTKLMIKKLFEETPLDQAVEDELKHLVDGVNRSNDAGEGIKAILEKRKPVFSGR